MRLIRSDFFLSAICFVALFASTDAKGEVAPGESAQVEAIVANLKRGTTAEPLLDTALLETISARMAPASTSAKRNLALAEAARTDKQVGASSNSPGATSLIEKAGVPYLLSLALEHGAIQQDHTATTVSLSTTPYMFLFLGNRDTPENFQRYGYLRKLGVSASFAADKGGDTTVNDLKTEDISEITLRYQVYGDRSTRSAEFQKCWRNKEESGCPKWDKESLGDLQQNHTNLVVAALGQVDRCNLVKSPYRSAAAADLDALRNNGDSDPTPKVRAILDHAADQLIRDPQFSSCLHQVPETMAKVSEAGAAYAAAAAAYAELYMEAQDLLTLSVSQHPIDDGTDFTDIKLVYDRSLLGCDLTANAELALNTEPGDGSNAGADQDTLRDYGATVALARELPFKLFDFRGSDSNPKPMMLTFAGKFSYSEELDDPIGSAQLKIDIPVVAGLTLPLALTYTSRTETDSDDQFIVNVGTGFDLDSLMALIGSN